MSHVYANKVLYLNYFGPKSFRPVLAGAEKFFEDFQLEFFVWKRKCLVLQENVLRRISVTVVPIIPHSYEPFHKTVFLHKLIKNVHQIIPSTSRSNSYFLEIINRLILNRCMVLHIRHRKN